MTEDQAVLDSIEYLLRLSNKNIIETDFCSKPLTATVLPHVSGGIAGSMETREVRVFDNDTYYFDSYGLIVDGYTVKSDGSHGKSRRQSFERARICSQLHKESLFSKQQRFLFL